MTEEKNKDNLVKSLIVVVLAHGGNDCILLDNNDILSFEDLLSQFDADSFHLLRNNPKIFIFQACRQIIEIEATDNSAENESDPTHSTVQQYSTLSTPKKEQFHEMYATIKGEAAYRGRDGSKFIRAFILAMCYLQKSNERTIKEVTRYVHFWANQSTENMESGQLPTCTQNLAKDYFFSPRNTNPCCKN
ncbi:DgyrCDS14463 [Dimorphilus gyrociliatus]|uniref:DgyrCDS14463 n=1 Tax=Dimorphilus gyrociliatus TaxID=2664684 RepID=A0A7I8WDW6_9ANNE|nr:DgyrCDS14463 [Dimorphilus gyrociliatus]